MADFLSVAPSIASSSKLHRPIPFPPRYVRINSSNLPGFGKPCFPALRLTGFAALQLCCFTGSGFACFTSFHIALAFALR